MLYKNNYWDGGSETQAPLPSSAGESMNRWLERAVSIWKIAEGDDLSAKKSLCLDIFGPNLKMQNKNVV